MRAHSIRRFAGLLLTWATLASAASIAGSVTAHSDDIASMPAKRMMRPVAMGTSLPFSALPSAAATQEPRQGPAVRHPRPVQQSGTPGPGAADPVLQTHADNDKRTRARARFAGIGSSGYSPSDSNIAVGKASGGGYIVEGVNVSVAVYNKSGTRLSGPVELKSFWSSLGGNCGAYSGGDPIILYDSSADRWIISQMAYDSGMTNNYECVAVSTTSDPRGTYYQYAYSYGSTLNDFPKMAVWATPSNSAYLATFNLFAANGTSYAGAQICALDRAAMLTGSSATMLCFTSNGSDYLSLGSFLPAEPDGPVSPSEGPIFLALNGTSSLYMYQWNGLSFTGDSGTLSGRSISVAPFTAACATSTDGACIPQPGTTMNLDSLNDRLNYRLAYRVLPDHVAMVVNHPVTSGSSTAIRWYEIRKQATFDSAQCDGALSASFVSNQYSLCQQGTYAPNASFRWMGSAAIDGSGNIALGYSVSSSTVYPSIAYAGRTPTMTPGTLGAETVTTAGAGSQTSSSRWGDYTSLRVDPDDDQTFWYVNQYYASSTATRWSTAINSFRVAAGSSTVAFGAASYSVSEGTASITIPVTRTNTTAAASVNYATAGGTATSGSDFTAQSGTLSFAAGTATMNISVPIINDTAVESSETFTVSLSAPSSGLTLGTPSTTTVTILDNDTAATVAFGAASYSVSEGTASITIPVTRTNTTAAASVNYATAGGTATSGSDFTAKSGTLSFAAGTATMNISIPIINDTAVESSETFTVSLSAPSSGLTLGTPSTTTVTILDNDSSSSVTTLQNGVAVSGISGSTGSNRYYAITVPVGAANLVIQTSGGTGDVDLYVKLGSQPTTASYDCGPFLAGNAESCSAASPTPGTYYVLLNGYSAYSTVTLKASYTVTTTLTNNVAVSNISGASGSTLYYSVNVPAGASNLQIAISGGTGDADLYVKAGALPTTATYDCRPYLGTNNETCSWSTPSAAVFYIMLRGYSAYSGVKLLASYAGTLASKKAPGSGTLLPSGLGARHSQPVVPG